MFDLCQREQKIFSPFRSALWQCGNRHRCSNAVCVLNLTSQELLTYADHPQLKAVLHFLFKCVFWCRFLNILLIGSNLLSIVERLRLKDDESPHSLFG